MTNDKISSKPLYFAIIILVAVVSVLPIVYFGIPDTVDTIQHYKFADIYYHSFRNGDFSPGWSDKENYGYGGVGIRFYPPLEYYFLAILRIIVGNWYDASWISFMFWMILGSFGIYFWSRCWLSPKHSTVAACIFVIIPVHLSHLYTSFNVYAEFAAASLLTFCLGFTTRIFQRGKWTDALGLGIFYALLVLTHLPFAIISSVCLAIYALLLWQKKNGIKPFIKCVAAGIIGVSASSFYWIGMLTEMKWLRHASENYSSGAFDYKKGFFPFFYFRATDTTFGSWISDVSTLLTFLFLASSVFYFIYRSKNKIEVSEERSIFRTVLPLGLFTLFMVTPLSSLVWQIITPLQKIQFPVRWLPVMSMCGALVAVASFQYFLKGEFHKQRIWVYASGLFGIALGVFNAIYVIHPMSFVPISREKFESKAMTPINAESFSFWWAIWSKNAAFTTTDKILADERSSKIITWEAEERIFEITEGNTENVRVATFYYPHWQATVNDQPVTVGKDENGVILIPVPKENSLVKLTFREPFVLIAAGYFSIFVWFGIFLVILFLFGKKALILQQNIPQLHEVTTN